MRYNWDCCIVILVFHCQKDADNFSKFCLYFRMQIEQMPAIFIKQRKFTNLSGLFQSLGLDNISK